MIDSLIEQHGRRLYGFCLTLCKSKDFADELYQETWLKVLDKIEKYDNSRPFENWLTKICVNTYRDMLRKMKRLSFADDSTALEKIQSEEKEDYSSLKAAVENLPEKLKVAVILHYFSDLDEKTTADMLGIPLGTVKSRLFKAKKLLRKELESDEQFTF